LFHSTALTRQIPPPGLLGDANGDLFGTTSDGGASSEGTVFEIVKTSTGYASVPTTLVSFNGSNGANPSAQKLRCADMFTLWLKRAMSLSG
jgi:uncharacterized repeat protein (TIGR03803 family)